MQLSVLRCVHTVFDDLYLIVCNSVCYMAFNGLYLITCFNVVGANETLGHSLLPPLMFCTRFVENLVLLVPFINRVGFQMLTSPSHLGPNYNYHCGTDVVHC